MIDGRRQHPDNELLRALRGRPLRRYSQGSTLFHAGDPCDTMLVVAIGRVAVRVTTLRGESVIASVGGPGTLLGTYGVLGESRRHAVDAVALEDVAVHVVSRAQFDELVSGDPGLLRIVALALADESTRLTSLVSDAYWERAEARVRRRIVELAAIYAVGSGAEVPLTHEQIAAFAGVTRPTVTTVLSEAVRAGLLRCARGRVLVEDVAPLQQWA